MNTFNYENTETKIQKGGKIVRKVSIKKGRGYKSITKYHKGKKRYSVKKPIHKSHIQLIKKGKFIPGLFNDCKNCKTKKRKGGNKDEEWGPEILDVKPYPIPPDPERFKRYEERMRMDVTSPNEAERLFAGPNPEEKQAIERNKMAWEDPLNQDPFDREPLKIFSGGKNKRQRKGGDINTQIPDNQRKTMLSQLQNLMRQNQQNTQRFQEIDDILYEIEQMTPQERALHIEQERELNREMDEITNLNNELQNHFEQLRNEYFQRYGIPEIQTNV